METNHNRDVKHMTKLEFFTSLLATIGVVATMFYSSYSYSRDYGDKSILAIEKADKIEMRLDQEVKARQEADEKHFGYIIKILEKISDTQQKTREEISEIKGELKSTKNKN